MILYTIVNLDDVYFPERYAKPQAENNFSTDPYDYLKGNNLYLKEQQKEIWRNYGTFKSNF